MTDHDLLFDLHNALHKLDELIESGKHPENYASTYTAEDSGKTSGLIKARKIIKEETGF